MNLLALMSLMLGLYCVFQSSAWACLLLPMAARLFLGQRRIVLSIVFALSVLHWQSTQRVLLDQSKPFYAVYRIDEADLALDGGLAIRIVENSGDADYRGRRLRLRVSRALDDATPWFYRGRIMLRSAPKNHDLPLFDFGRWLRAEGYAGRALAIGPQAPTGTQINLKKNHLYGVSKRLLAFEHGPMLFALASGDTSLLSRERLLLLRQAGVGHLMAVSGLHIGVLFVLVRALCKAIAYHGARFGLSQRALTAPLFLMLLLPYLYLISWPISALRAGLMIVLAMGLWRAGIRRPSTLLLALGSCFVFWPSAVQSVGFWLSWSMAAAIVLGGRFMPAIRPISYLCFSGFVAVISAGLSSHFFGYWSVAAVVNNLVLVPLVSVLVYPLCVLGVLFGDGFFAVADRLLNVGDWLIEASARWLPQRHIGLLPGPWAVLMVISALLLCLPLANRFKALPLVMVVALLFMPSKFAHLQAPVILADTHRGVLKLAKTTADTALANDAYIAKSIALLTRQAVEVTDTDTVLGADLTWAAPQSKLCNAEGCVHIDRLARVNF